MLAGVPDVEVSVCRDLNIERQHAMQQGKYVYVNGKRTEETRRARGGGRETIYKYDRRKKNHAAVGSGTLWVARLTKMLNTASSTPHKRLREGSTYLGMELVGRTVRREGVEQLIGRIRIYIRTRQLTAEESR